MPEVKPKSKPYVINVGEGVDDRLRECQNELHRLRSAMDSATSEDHLYSLTKTYMSAIQTFTHSLVSMVTSSDMGDVFIHCDRWIADSFEWSKGPKYHGGMIRHGNEWGIHT